jgi:uncharacterized membrane protein YedE/YeeE
MLTDRMTTRVLGLLVLVLALIIVASCFLFARAETRQNPRYSVVVAVSSLPMFVVGGLLLRKGQRMKEDEDEAD